MSRDPDRDRDERGRARNARPRDRLGRPLPRGKAGVAPWPDESELTPDESLTTAQELLERGWPFQAHEVLEAAWRTASEQEQALWQGLAQLAVGVTHAARGNRRGALALLERGRSALEPYWDTAPHAIDVPGLLAWVSSCLDLLSETRRAAVALDPPRLLLPRPHARCHGGDLTNSPELEVSTSAGGPHVTADPVDVISRWELFGGVWRVIARSGPEVTISLCRCDGGEEQQRIISDDPALAAWLGDRTSSAPDSPPVSPT